MKIRKFCVAFCVSLTVIFASHSLVSCSLVPGYTEPEEQSIAAALGFDASDGNVKVTVQISESEGKKSRAISGEGATIESAVSSLVAGETKAIETAHVSIIALGKGIDAAWFAKIMDYCARNEDISVSAQLISCTDANALLSIESAGGYELSGAISKSRENSSVGAECRFYQIENALSRKGATFAIPYFTADEGKLELYGVRIYRDGEARVILNRVESAYYMMIRGLFDRGLLDSDAPGLSGSVGISDCKTKYDFSREGDAVVLTVNCVVTLDSELANDEYADEICHAAQKGMERLYLELSSRHGDLFGFLEAADRKGVSSDRLSDSLIVVFECTERR